VVRLASGYASAGFLRNRSGKQCGGYKVIGYNSIVNGSAILGDMQVAKRSLSDLTQVIQLVWPVAFRWGVTQHFSWTNVTATDSVPVCLSTYEYEDNQAEMIEPYQGEIDCVETDGLQSTVWRFAHNRATFVEGVFHSQPLGSVSRDGRFFAFQSNWDEQLGYLSNGEPRADVWIVKLE